MGKGLCKRSQPYDRSDNYMNKEKKRAEAQGKPIGLLTALLLLGLMLFVDFLFAPAVINFTGKVTGYGATIETVVRSCFLLFFFQLLLVILFYLFVRPVAELRLRLILYFLFAESLILCVIWAFDAPQNYFRSESSAMTYFSSVVLILVATGAFVNLFFLWFRNQAGKAVRIFWGLLAAAFLFAALDEFFKIHEAIADITNVPNWGQDLLTASYAAGGIFVLALFYKTFRHTLFNWQNYFPRLLVAGILTLGLSSFFDTFDRGFHHFFGRYYDVNHLCNSLEELLEFTAACAFCCACLINLLESEDHRLLKQLENRARVFLPSWKRKAGFAGLVLLTTAGLLGIKQSCSEPDGIISRLPGCRISLFADMTDDLFLPDGLFFHPDLGLVVCNEGTGELLVFDHDGQSRVFVDVRSNLISPEGLAFTSNSIFVSDDSKGKISSYTLDGNWLGEVYSEGLISPEGLAVDDQSRLYIADEGLSMILRQTGTHREILASSLDGLITPEEMVFDQAGNLYITDEGAQSIFKRSPDGKFVRFADNSTGLVCPEGIVIHNNMIYVTEDRTGCVFRFAPDGTGQVLIRFGRNYSRISGIAFDDRDCLYLVAKSPLSRKSAIFKVEFDEADLSDK